MLLPRLLSQSREQTKQHNKIIIRCNKQKKKNNNAVT